VKSVAGDGDDQTTEAFVRQVAERIEGVIESKLTSPTAPYIPVLPTAYPGLNYSAPTYYHTTYSNVPTPQVGYNIVNTPQGSNIIPRNVNEVATNNTPSIIKVSDTNE